MFRKLRNRLILINFTITTVVIVTIFTAIYMISTRGTENPRRVNERISIELWGEEVDSDSNGIPDEFDKILDQNIRQEKEATAERLLLTLIISGIAIELVVIFVSYFMAEEAIKPVKDAYEAQKIFIANASHEIKTPLAAISANLEAADIHGNKWIDNVELEAEKLTRLNKELLNLARTDLMTERAVEEVDLTKILNDIILKLTPRMKNLEFKKKISLPKKTRINREDFEQLINILLDNAIKYADKKILLRAENHTLVISNDGAKIPKEKLPHVFERFYQVDKSREGVGLGLSIAKTLADKNNWKLAAESDKMTTFTLIF